MSVVCGVCANECVQSDKNSIIKCSLCSTAFHVQCVKTDGVTTRTNVKDFKCNDCKKDTASSVSSNKPSSTTLTKEFLLSVLESFKKDVSSELKNYSVQFEEFKESVQFLSDGIDKSNELTEKLRDEYASIRKQNELLLEQNKKLNETVYDLNVRLRNLEQYTRRNNIEISGIPQTPNEDSFMILKDVGKALGQELKDNDVAAVHRVPTYNTNRAPPIVVQFQARMQRDAWISSFKKKRTLTAKEINPTFPKEQSVYVNEHLSPENKKLLGQLKQKCRERNVKFVWVKDGKFFVKKKEGDKTYKVNVIEDFDVLVK